MINLFPKVNSVGNRSPKELFTGIKTNYIRDCKIGFGEYVQVHEDDQITNTLKERTLAAISLGNLQGSYKFLSLTTGKVVKRRDWTHVPMTGRVIELLNSRAERENLNLNVNMDFKFGNKTVDDHYDDDFVINEQNEPVIQEIANQPVVNEDFESDEIASEPDKIRELPSYEEPIIEQLEHDHEPVQEPEPEHEPVPALPVPEAQVLGRYNLRSNRSNWKDRFVEEYAIVVKSDMFAKQAIKRFGDEAKQSIRKELFQMHEKKVRTPFKKESVTNKALRSIMFLKRRRDNRLKARCVADGKKQDRSMSKEVSSPTSRTESLFIIAATNAKENRIVISADIEAAFLEDYWPDEEEPEYLQ
jgi:hypothetical protein